MADGALPSAAAILRGGGVRGHRGRAGSARPMVREAWQLRFPFVCLHVGGRPARDVDVEQLVGLLHAAETARPGAVAPVASTNAVVDAKDDPEDDPRDAQQAVSETMTIDVTSARQGIDALPSPFCLSRRGEPLPSPPWASGRSSVTCRMRWASPRLLQAPRSRRKPSPS